MDENGSIFVLTCERFSYVIDVLRYQIRIYQKVWIINYPN